MDVWTLGLAIWATLVSTFLLIFRWVHFRRERPNVRVEYLLSFEKQSDGSWEPYWLLKAFNLGRRKIMFYDYGLRLSNGDDFNAGEGKYWSETVAEQSSVQVKISSRSIKEFLEERPDAFIKSAWFQDISGNYYETEVERRIAEFYVHDVFNIPLEIKVVDKDEDD